jgi:hypothetical protein
VNDPIDVAPTPVRLPSSVRRYPELPGPPLDGVEFVIDGQSSTGTHNPSLLVAPVQPAGPLRSEIAP